MVKQIFLDLDGVIANWDKSALRLLGLERDLETQRRIMEAEDLTSFHPEVYDMIRDVGLDFWENIEPFPWAERLYKDLSNIAQVSFLTSGGNYAKRGAKFVADACNGKLHWLEKHFPYGTAIFTNAKYQCARPEALLVDDNRDNINRFIENGGVGFLWPLHYHIENGTVSYDETLDEIRKKIS